MNTNLQKEYGLTEKELSGILKAKRVIEALEDDGLKTKRQVNSEYPGLNWDSLVNTFGSERAQKAESFIRNLREMKTKTSIRTFREAISSDMFDSIITTSMNAIAAKEFDAVPLLFEPFTEIGESADLQTNDLLRLNDFADLENADNTGGMFNEFVKPGEEKFSFTVNRRGNVLAEYLDAKVNDRLDIFGAKAKKIANSATRALNKFVLVTSLSDNPTLTDGNALFDNTNRKNDPNAATGVALNYSYLSAAWNAAAAQTDTDGNPIELGDSFIILTGPKKYAAGLTLMGSDLNPFTANNEKNILKPFITDVIKVPYWTYQWSIVFDSSKPFHLSFLTGHQRPNIIDLGEDALTEQLKWIVKQHSGGTWQSPEAIIRGSTVATS